MKILIVEDNLIISKGLKHYLESEQYDIDVENNYQGALNSLDKNYDLIILDVTLPDGNGFDLCKYIKEEYNYPVIFLTAKDTEDDIVRGLELADDYIVKPFLNRELLMRIKKLLKNNIKSEHIRIDLERYEVYKDDKLINLTSLEFKLFLLLMNNKNKVVSKELLLDKIEEETGNMVYDNTLRVYIKRIREKLNDEKIIKVVKGIGYIIDEKENNN